MWKDKPIATASLVLNNYEEFLSIGQCTTMVWDRSMKGSHGVAIFCELYIVFNSHNNSRLTNFRTFLSFTVIKRSAYHSHIIYVLTETKPIHSHSDYH